MKKEEQDRILEEAIITAIANEFYNWQEEYKQGLHTKSAVRILEEDLHLPEKIAVELVRTLIEKYTTHY